MFLNIHGPYTFYNKINVKELMGDTSVILLLYFDHIFVNLSIGKLSEKGIFFSSHSSTVERF